MTLDPATYPTLAAILAGRLIMLPTRDFWKLTAREELLALAGSLGLATLRDYPNLEAVVNGAVSGSPLEWPGIRAELRRLCSLK